MISDIIGFWSLAIATTMQPETFGSLPTSGLACPASAVPQLFFPPRRRRQSSVPAAKDWSVADDLLQKQQIKGGSRSLRRLAGRALLPTVGHGPNFNLKARFCCRFAAGAAIDEGRLNQLLRRQQPTAPTGWPSIAVTAMLTGYRDRRRIAA
jgi:hypothetical protein